MSRWAYHNTPRRNLDSISRRGLVPVKYEREQPATLYFDSTLRYSAERLMDGDVTLRFPWPKDAAPNNDWWDSERRVPASKVDVRIGSRWVSLVP